MKKFETRLRIIMTLEKLEGRRNLRARHGSRLTVSSLHGLHVYTESEAKEVCWNTWRSLACPSTSRTLFSGLRVSPHGKQVAPLFRQVLTDFARGGRRANSSPGPARGPIICAGTNYGTTIIHIILPKRKLKLQRGEIVLLCSIYFDFAGTYNRSIYIQTDFTATQSINIAIQGKRVSLGDNSSENGAVSFGGTFLKCKFKIMCIF